MSKKIFVGNYKGGVGKTTSVYSIANNLAEKNNKSILLIDLDPQSSLSEICVRACSNTNFLKSLDDRETLNYVFDMYINKIRNSKSVELKFDFKTLIKKCKNVSFIPSSLFYKKNSTISDGLDTIASRMEENIEYLSILKQFIDLIDVEYEFDYIFIDCPPTNNIITQGAFLISDLYLIPTILDGISTNGVMHYINTVDNIYNKYCKDDVENYLFNKHFFGEKAKLIGIFFTLIRNQVKYDNDRKTFEDEIKTIEIDEDIYIFNEYISNYIDIARKVAEGDISNKHQDYEKLTQELDIRLQTLIN